MAAKKRAYKKIQCSKKKAAATAKKKALHKKGYTATVKKTADGYCVYSAGKRKSPKK